MKRRNFLKLSAIFGVSSVTTSTSLAQQGTINEARESQSNTLLKATPAEIKGPFYPLVAQDDRDFDLTKIEGKDGVAAGTQVYIEGRVVDAAGHLIEGVTVDVWQANSHGKYRHPYDSSTAPVDEYFQGWAIVKTDSSGSFRFKTVVPGPYSVSADWQRPPHIHFKIGKNGYDELITQMYFPSQPLNRVDRLLKKKSQEEQALMIATKSKQTKNGLDVYHYTIVLKKI